MSSFSDAFEKIGTALQDLTSLEVTTYTGKVTITGQGLPTDFSAILDRAQGDASFQIAATTKCELDGDMRVFYDSDLGVEGREDHRDLVESAQKNRQAILDLFREAITSALGK